MTARLQGFGLARDQMRSALASGAGISPADLDALEHLEAAGRSPNASSATGCRLPPAPSPCWSTGSNEPGGYNGVSIRATAGRCSSSCRRRPPSSPRPAWPPTTRGSSSSRQAFPTRTGKPLPASCKPPPTRLPTRSPAFAAGLPGDARRPQRRPQRDKARDAITYSHQDQVGMPLPDRPIDHLQEAVLNGIAPGRHSAAMVHGCSSSVRLSSPSWRSHRGVYGPAPPGPTPRT